MRIRFFLISIALLVMGLGGIAWWANQSYQQSLSTISLWQTQFIDMKGNVQKIAQPKTCALVVNFWASWCEPCREEIPMLGELATSFRGQVDFIGVAVDNEEAIQRFLTKIAVPYPILLGQADVISLMKAEGNTTGGLPFTLVYAANGQLIMAKAGKIDQSTLTKCLRSALYR